jgi:hypothetical protein
LANPASTQLQRVDDAACFAFNLKVKITARRRKMMTAPSMQSKQAVKMNTAPSMQSKRLSA